MKPVQTVTRMGILIALGVVASYMSAIPAFGAKLFPAQAALNVIAGALLGPWYAAVAALLTAGIRIALGTGTPLAIPGSVFGACLAGLFYRWTRSRWGAVVGEALGTGVIGAIVSYPIATLLLGNKTAAGASLLYYVPIFGISSVAGAILGGIALVGLERTQPFQQRQHL